MNLWVLRVAECARGGRILVFDTGAGIITLTGWVALAALVSLVIVVVGSIVFAYRRWAGLDKPQVVVTKQGDV